MGNHVDFITDDGHEGSSFFWHVGNEFLSHGLFLYHSWDEVISDKAQISVSDADSEVVVKFCIDGKCVGMFLGDEVSQSVTPMGGKFTWHST